MSIISKYKSYWQSGQWHVHTRYTDGQNSVDEIVNEAVKRNIPLIAFTEHVRAKLEYSFDELVCDVERARKKYSLPVLVGCESKVLPDGSLDVSAEVLKKCQIVLIAFHSFPLELETYLFALEVSLKNPVVDVWAHPGLFLQKKNLSINQEQINNIIQWCKQGRTAIEHNKRYRLPKKNWLSLFIKQGIPLLNGSDIHAAHEL